MNQAIKQNLILMKKGLDRVGGYIWDILLIPSPFAPIMFFYLVAPPLIVYLYFTAPLTKIALDILANDTGLPWFFPVIVFIVCSTMGYQFRSAKLNAFLTIPMFAYAILLMVESITGHFNSGSLISTLFLAVSAWATLTVTRYYQELQEMKLAIIAIKKKMGVVDGEPTG